MRSVIRPSLFLLCLALGAPACSDDSTDGGFVLADEVQFSLSPSSLSFPALGAGDTATRTVTMRHIGGSGTLRILGVSFESASPDLSMSGPREARLAAGEEVSWDIRYQADDAASDLGKLVVAHNVVGTPTVEVPVATPGFRGELLLDPKAIDFGPVEHGDEASRPLRLQNIGSADLTVSAATFGDGGEDFFLDPKLTLPWTVAAGADTIISVGYRPTRWDADEAVLRLTLGDESEVPVPVSGSEVGPVIQAQPPQVGLGPVAVGVTRVETLALANVGSTELTLEDIQLAAGAVAGLAIDGIPAQLPAPIAPGDRLWLDILFTPTEAGAAGQLGQLLVVSDDPGSPQLAVPIVGVPGAPRISVVPSALDFGFVGQGVETGRKLTLLNTGQIELSVDAIVATDTAGGAFGVPVDPTFKPTFEVPSPQTLAPGEAVDVRVTFRNDADSDGGGGDPTVWGSLEVRSTDPDRPTVTVVLKARRAGDPTCAPAFAPALVHFGDVAHLTVTTRHISLINQGTGTCTLQQLWVDACAGDLSSQTCSDGQPSPQFELATLPPLPLTLGPGEATAVDVRFEAPFFQPTGEGEVVARHYARVGAAVHDPHAGVIRKVPQAGPGLIPGPNLHAASGIPRLDVYPEELDFGLVPRGCTALPGLITLSSGGPVPVTVTSLGPGQCDEGFGLESPPALPHTLQPGQPLGLSLAFTGGETLGARSCGYQVASDDPAWPVRGLRLSATTVEETSITEVFTGDEVSLVDVLFVVDDSGSMSEEQLNLAANFEAFIAAAAEWNVDYQIAVTTTDMDKMPGALKGQTPLVTPDNPGDFITNVLVGTGGSGLERGLAAADASLSGAFGPHLREEASLAVIFISDEDDQSPEDPAYYAASYEALKSDASRFAAYAIVGEPGGCDSVAGSASAGLRYIYVADTTGGDRASICDGSFAEALADFGEGAFGPKTVFPLTGTPEPSSVVVELDGAPCSEGWEVDATTRRLVFDADGPCVPSEGSEVRVSYDLICL